MPALGIGVGVSFVRPGLADADAAALVQRMAVPPTPARRLLIDRLVKDLKGAGVWQALDALYVMAAHDAQAARLNWRSSLLGLTPVAAPVFTVDRGYQGDGAAACLAIDNADADTIRFTLTSASVGVWLNLCAAESRSVVGRASDHRLQVIPLSAVDTLTVQFANVSGSYKNSTVPGYTGLGMTRATREESTQYFVRPHGQARIVRALPIPTPTAPACWPQRLLGGMNSSAMTFSTARIAAAYFGGALTSAQEVAIDAALQAYLSAVGVA